MTIVLVVICVGVAMLFLGLLFGSMLRDGELRELEKQLAERMGELDFLLGLFVGLMFGLLFGARWVLGVLGV